MTHFGTFCDARGNLVEMVPGDCLWCGQHVVVGREEAGATNPNDPAWKTEDGDFGCDHSPEAGQEGCGSHARPFDLARKILGPVG